MLIENGRIAAIAPSLDAPDGAETIDAAGMIVMPGLVNGHLHTWQSALRGIAADWTVARIHAGDASRARDALSARGHLHRQPDGRAQPDQRRRDHAGRLVPQQSDARRTPTRRSTGWRNPASAPSSCTARPSPIRSRGRSISARSRCRAREIERLRKGRFASDDGLMTFGLAILGPYYSVWDVTRAGRRACQRARPDLQHARGRRHPDDRRTVSSGWPPRG